MPLFWKTEASLYPVKLTRLAKAETEFKGCVLPEFKGGFILENRGAFIFD